MSMEQSAQRDRVEQQKDKHVDPDSLSDVRGKFIVPEGSQPKSGGFTLPELHIEEPLKGNKPYVSPNKQGESNIQGR